MALSENVGFFNVRPPALEDAGIEDAALPVYAIQEAFKRAADALQTAPWHVQSAAVRTLGGFETVEKQCGESPGRGKPIEEESVANGNRAAALGEMQSCVDTKAEGVVEKGHDLLVGLDVGPYESDKVEFGKEGGLKLGDKACVEGLAGDRGEVNKKPDDAQDGPILVLG